MCPWYVTVDWNYQFSILVLPAVAVIDEGLSWKVRNIHKRISQKNPCGSGSGMICSRRGFTKP
jgi:hypothetical protein